MSTKASLVVVERSTEPVEREDLVDPRAPVVGQWYWYERDKKKRDGWDEEDLDEDGEATPKYKTVTYKDIVCVTHVGTNYAAVTFVGEGTERIHIDGFPDLCTHEPDAEQYINRRVEEKRQKVAQLMERVHKVTAALGVGQLQRLGDGSETNALARITGDEQPVEEYKAALIKAKDETLPELFQQIKDVNESMSRWMSATLIPLKAEAAALKPLIKKIEGRVFNVELYAGLTEEVVQCREGDPAPDDEKVRLFQRRHYMDEECLARYEHGGMDFKSLKAFDAWIARDDNFERLLPFPRCLVAFRVRRNRKDYDMPDISTFINIMFGRYHEKNEKTYLYMRNGDQLFRLATGIEFDEKLFPDLDGVQLEGPLYCKMPYRGDIEKVITKDKYEFLVAEYDREVAENKRAKAENDKLPEDHPDKKHAITFRMWSSDDPRSEYTLFNDDSVFYDEMRQHVQDQMDKHNRLVLVLQGLLDRSPIFHPHPPWQLWTPEGFHGALDLIFDQDKALTAGEKPDFQAYAEQLRGKIKKGSITIGQQRVWTKREHDKDYKRNAWRSTRRGEYLPSTPFGDPGPGRLAEVKKYSSAGCTYEWTRERQKEGWGRDGRYHRYGDPISCKIRIDRGELFNVSAYTPGDYKQFFDDPRTRAEYLKWAPFLLEAEEYHARRAREAELTEREQGMDTGGFSGPCRHSSRIQDGGPDGDQWRCVGCGRVFNDEDDEEEDED